MVVATEALEPSFSVPMWALVLAVLLGAGIAIFILRHHHQSTPHKPWLKPWTDLMEHQVIEEEFDGRSLARWVKAHLDDYTEGRVMLAVKCTEAWVSRLGYEYPEDLDEQKNIIAFLCDQTSGETIHIQLFSFGSIGEKINAELGTKGEMVIAR